VRDSYKTLLTVFRPNFFTVIVFAFLLVLQVVFFGSVRWSSGTSLDPVYRMDFGIGDPVVIHAKGSADMMNTGGIIDKVSWSGTFLRLCLARVSRRLYYDPDALFSTAFGEDRTAIQINGIFLLLILVSCYCLAIFVDSVVRRTIGPRWLIGIWATLAVGVFVLSIMWNKAEWGYFLRRPDLPSEVDTIACTRAIIPVTTERSDAGECRIRVDNEFSLSKCLSWAERDAYYCLEGRVLLYLKQRTLLPNALTLDVADLTGLYDLLPKTGLLAKPQEGYEESHLLTGVVVDAVTQTNRRLVFLGVRGGAVSNDHYPYYEFVFKERDRGQGLTFVQGQRFFYDVAGTEGFEWESMWIALSLGLTAVSLPILMVILIAWIAIQALMKAEALN